MRLRFLMLGVIAVAILALSSSSAAAAICPAQATIQTSATASCYWPNVVVTVSPASITAGQSSVVSWSITGADPAIGCSKGGAWSGGVSVDSGGNSSGSASVSPSVGSHTYSITCPANPEAGYGQAVLVVGEAGSEPPPDDHNSRITTCTFNTNVSNNMPTYVRGSLNGSCTTSGGVYLQIRATTCLQKTPWPTSGRLFGYQSILCASKTVWGLSISQSLTHFCDYTTLLSMWRTTAVVTVTDLSTGQTSSKTSTTPGAGPGQCHGNP